MNTNDLIEALVKDGAPVHPLRRPSVRVLIWLVCAIPMMGLVVMVMGLRSDLSELLADRRWTGEQAFALFTAVMASLAAFHLSVPGHSSRWVALPIVALVGWLLVLGWGCLLDVSARGAGAFSLIPEPECFAFISLLGLLPAAFILRMVHSGAPVFAAHTLFSAALAAAALGAFGLRLVHDQDLGLMVLVWQFGSVVLIAAIGWIAGPHIFRWPQSKWSQQ